MQLSLSDALDENGCPGRGSPINKDFKPGESGETDQSNPVDRDTTAPPTHLVRGKVKATGLHPGEEEISDCFFTDEESNGAIEVLGNPDMIGIEALE